jgi:hypothetical protein
MKKLPSTICTLGFARLDIYLYNLGSESGVAFFHLLLQLSLRGFALFF